jgi:BirA family biotin operon repressor/biotin-[acetyl-CoA-carboxylase] ligase
LAHGFKVEHLGMVASTQDVLRGRVTAGLDVTAVAVRAREQSAGRGRRGSSWTSLAGGSYQSVGLPTESVSELLALALGIGIADELTAAGAATVVKWPNDLVLGGRKLGGIIVEVVAGVPIAGIGVNVANDVPRGAASLRGWDVDGVGDLVLTGVERGLNLCKGGTAVVAERFATVDWLRGKSVVVAGTAAAGIGQGVDAKGRLRLVRPDGEVMVFTSGHVVSVDGVRWGAR